MRHISYAAMARILQSAVAECTIVTPIKCIIRYAETLSTDDIPAIILDREDFQRYKAMIDLAAERSARARMAARRRAAMRKVEAPKRSEEAVAPKSVDNSSAPSTPSDSPAPAKATNRSPQRHSHPNATSRPASHKVTLRGKPIKLRLTRAKNHSGPGNHPNPHRYSHPVVRLKC